MSRGRNADTPLQIPGMGWLDIAWRIWGRIQSNRLTLIAAGVAFYGLLSLFPAITATVAIVGLIFDAGLLLERAQFLLDAMPDAAAQMIATQITEVANAQSDSLGWTAIAALALALWSASKGTGSVIEGLNLINHEAEGRGFLRLKAVTIALTLALVVTVSVSVLVVAAIPAVLVTFGTDQRLADWALLLRWPVMFTIGVFAIAALYRFAPSRRSAKWRWLSPGALLACALWVVVSYGFSLYVESFGAYNRAFGAIAGVVILLTWLWLSAFVVLLGAQLDAEIEAQTARDTTTGPDRTMGQRGAYKADHLGERFKEEPPD